MIHHHVAPGTDIFCHSCRHRIAIVVDIEVSATHEGVNEVIQFQDVFNGEMFFPSNFEFCQVCKSLWFCNGYFVPWKPGASDSVTLAREVKRLNESLNFYYEKASRQGQFIAVLADDIAALEPQHDSIEFKIYKRLTNFVMDEAKIMSERVRQGIEESD